MWMDIGVSDVYVAGTACTVDQCPSAVPLYDETLSSTAVNDTTTVSPFVVEGGLVDGYFVTDTITMGSVTVSQAEFRPCLDFLLDGLNIDT